jgi:predicted amidophosphoribosyltransferase
MGSVKTAPKGRKMIICSSCGRDLNAIGSDNVSCECGQPMCEDCGRIYAEEQANENFWRQIERSEDNV